MQEGLNLALQRQFHAPDARDKLTRGLCITLVPAELLVAPDAQRIGKLARHPNCVQVERPPACQLRAVAEVEILGQGVGLPPASRLNCAAAPDPAGAVEWDNAAGPAPRRLLDREVALQHHLLGAGHTILRRVQKIAARLNEGEIGIADQRRHAPPEKISRRNVIDVEQSNVGLVRTLQAGLERSGLKSRAICSLKQQHVETVATKLHDRLLRQFRALVGAVVEYLDLQADRKST